MVQDSPVPRPDRQELAAIALGGAAGALLRVALSQSYTTAGASWPWVTFAVNIAGAILLGYFVTRLQERLPLSAYRRPLLGTGFCGALTTFSTMQLELLRMLDRDHAALARLRRTNRDLQFLVGARHEPRSSGSVRRSASVVSGNRVVGSIVADVKLDGPTLAKIAVNAGLTGQDEIAAAVRGKEDLLNPDEED